MTTEPRKKAIYVGAPAAFKLEQACQMINDALRSNDESVGCCYLVGSALERADWRDVDVRYIMADAAFESLFPRAGQHWEHDPRWLLFTVSIAAWLAEYTALPIDFQIQPQTHANARHAGSRSALGLRIARSE